MCKTLICSSSALPLANHHLVSLALQSGSWTMRWSWPVQNEKTSLFMSYPCPKEARCTGTYWWAPIVANNSSVHIRHVELACVQLIYLKKKTLVQSQAAARHDSVCQLSSSARSFSPCLLLSGSLVSQSPPPASATYWAVQQPVISSALAHTNKNTLKHHTLHSSGGSYLYTCEGIAGGSPWLSCAVAPARRG